MMIFHNPLFLILIIFLIPYLASLIYKKLRRNGAVTVSDTTAMKQTKPTWRVRLVNLPPWLTLLAVLLVIMALARPQMGLKQTQIRREGIDIALVLDVSPSMLAEDFKLKGNQVNRLEVVKAVASDFIKKRPDDRIGVVVFAGKTYILSPLTWDHEWCISRLNEIKIGMIEDGTAIGSALATAINRLKDSPVKSKVIILLTDGVNNSGDVAPETAAQAAKVKSIVIYTIGAGTKGLVPFPTTENGLKVYQNIRIDMDEALLTRIAESTGGRYFPAADTQSLTAVFERINKMKKTAQRAPVYQEYQELYPYFLLAALILFLIEAVLANTVLRRIP